MPLSKLKADSLNLGDTFVFTGDVTGEAAGALTLLQTQTASSSASVSFTTGIDSTYDEYWVIFTNVHPQTDATRLGWQGSTNGGSSYGVTTTSTHFIGYHREDDTATELSYKTANDLAQSTAFIQFEKCGNDNDENLNGILKLYNPSSTTYVKHFLGISSNSHEYPSELNAFIGGYLNTTSAIDAIQFKFDSGNIDAGTFQLFGVKQ